MTRPTVARLARSDDVRRVLRAGKRRTGHLMAVHGLLRAPRDDGAARFTVVASRRVGNAVQRNRAKRLLREAARSQAWRHGVDVVIVARGACVTSGLNTVRDELRQHGAQLGLLESSG